MSRPEHTEADSINQYDQRKALQLKILQMVKLIIYSLWYYSKNEMLSSFSEIYDEKSGHRVNMNI